MINVEHEPSLDETPNKQKFEIVGHCRYNPEDCAKYCLMYYDCTECPKFIEEENETN